MRAESGDFLMPKVESISANHCKSTAVGHSLRFEKETYIQLMVLHPESEK
jgi:hypothetical protein